MTNLIIFPSSYYSTQKVDEDLAKEYNAARETKLFDTIFFNYDKWFSQGQLELTEIPEGTRNAVYRGWMMKPEQYEQFYNALLENNIRLITTPKQYRLMHIFPNVYKQFGKDTPGMDIYPLHSPIDINELRRKYSRFMIKDFVKSVKGTDFPKFFDTNITQEEFDRWMEVFYQYRGKLLTGGICVKEYIDLKLYNGKTNEFRAFYVGNQLATMCRNSNQPDYTPAPPLNLLYKYRDLSSCYYTVDYAELADGTFKVIEAGDGSVSGLSPNQDIYSYYRTLYFYLNQE